jgi:hypothetical protein
MARSALQRSTQPNLNKPGFLVHHRAGMNISSYSPQTFTQSPARAKVWKIYIRKQRQLSPHRYPQGLGRDQPSNEERCGALLSSTFACAREMRSSDTTTRRRGLVPRDDFMADERNSGSGPSIRASLIGIIGARVHGLTSPRPTYKVVVVKLTKGCIYIQHYGRLTPIEATISTLGRLKEASRRLVIPVRRVFHRSLTGAKWKCGQRLLSLLRKGENLRKNMQCIDTYMQYQFANCSPLEKNGTKV